MIIEGTFLGRLYDAIRKEPFRRMIAIAPSYMEGYGRAILVVSDRGQGITNEDCIRVLEKSGIGWGKERYIKILGTRRMGAGGTTSAG